MAGTGQPAVAPDYYDLGVKSLEAEQYVQAQAHFQSEVALHPDNADAFASLGDTYVALEKYEDAVRAYEQAVSKYGPDKNEEKAITYYSLGHAYEELHNSRGAAGAYQNAINLNRDYAEAHSDLADINVRLGNWQEAVSNYQELIRINAGNADADLHFNLGVAYERLRMDKEAIESYTKSLSIKEAPQTLNRLCQLNYNAKLWQGVVESCVKFVGVESSNGAAHYYLGEAYSELEMHPQAAQAYQEAARINPNDFEALNNLGVAYSNMGRDSDAAAAFQSALKLEPDNVNAHFRLARVYSNSGRWEEASSELKYVVAAQPNNAKAHLLLGRASNRLNRPDEAVQAYRRVLEIEPNNEDANYHLAVVYIKLRDKSAALAQYNQLKSINPARAEKLLGEITQALPN